MNKITRRVFKSALLPAACAAVLGGCAPYEPYGVGSGPVYGSTGPVDTSTAAFDRIDGNRDGFLSRAELEAAGIRASAAPATPESATAAFHRLDTNGDGFLSRGEASGMFGAIPGASFDVADSDRNGFLSLAEAMPHLRWLERRNAPATVSFDAHDANRDGFLSRAEAEPLLRSAPSGAPYATGPVHTFDNLDANRDGFLSRAEAAPMANPPTFDRWDTNRDGFLSRAEADAMMRSGVGGTPGAYGGTVYGPRY